jgi:hypothetical protein
MRATTVHELTQDTIPKANLWSELGGDFSFDYQAWLRANWPAGQIPA